MRKNALDLSLQERYDLYKLREVGLGIREIGKRLKRSPSTISRELKRSRRGKSWGNMRWYERAKLAHESAISRRSCKRRRGLRLKNEVVRRYVFDSLKEKQLSPERISLRIRLEHPGESISHEAIYQYVFRVEKDLIQYLWRCSKRGRNKRSSGKRHRRAQDNKRRIDVRPKSVNEREVFGHHESDLIVSARGGRVVCWSL